ncbi:metal-dependent phosphohydrolase [Bradyrhizobium sp. Ai1a-2]|uniref:metal-dependent phosphohydrolase n=1 Tax=Bradyrhizobium sp. Ai1a-2 TaxID=196490 RepID=UPI0019175048|nr:metal-dependent phosphohydrolase [Bradyrhizobium sp. Ai1a-2]
MFNPTQIVIQAFVEQLKGKYGQIYGILEPAYPDIIGFVGRLALENIANSDAAYHDMNHTIMVTLVGQDILLGKHTIEGGVRPRDWLHFMISLLCHDIGYVRGVCRGDRNGQYVCNENGDLVQISAGATDASLTPYHVTRSKLFVRERFGRVSLTDIDTQEIEANIEHTRFPVPEGEEHTNTTDYPGLLRAADLIGQLADIDYLRKTSALFAEFRETGASGKLGYQTPDDLRAAYPTFSGMLSAPISATHFGICGSRRKASNGSPISMRTCSQKSTGEPLLVHCRVAQLAEAAGHQRRFDRVTTASGLPLTQNLRLHCSGLALRTTAEPTN